MKSYVYSIKNLKSGKEYIGATCNIALRLGNHMYRLTKGTHPNKLFQQDFTGDLHDYAFNYKEVAIEVAKQKESEAIALIPLELRYNHIDSGYIKTPDQKEKELSFDDYVYIYNVVDQYDGAGQWLMDRYGLSYRGNLYKIWFFAKYVLKAEYQILDLDFPKRTCNFWEKTQINSWSRIETLAIIQHIPRSSGIAAFLCGVKANHIRTFLLDGRWEVEKTYYNSLSLQQQQNIAFQAVKENGLDHLLMQNIDMAQGDFNLMIKAYLCEYILYNVEGKERGAAMKMTVESAKRLHTRPIFKDLIPYMTSDFCRPDFLENYLELVQTNDYIKLHHNIMVDIITNPKKSDSGRGREYGFSDKKIKGMKGPKGQPLRDFLTKEALIYLFH